jgi:hypothetical protein
MGDYNSEGSASVREHQYRSVITFAPTPKVVARFGDSVGAETAAQQNEKPPPIGPFVAKDGLVFLYRQLFARHLRPM